MAYIELTTDNIYEVIENNEIVIIDFWAPWCGPCISFSPIFEKVATQHSNVTFAKVNTEEQEEIAAHLQIFSIPNIMVFKEKALIYNQAGAKNEDALNALVQEMRELDMDEFRAKIEAERS